MVTKLYVDSASPVGSIIMWVSPSIPTNYLICDGSVFSGATYPQLAIVLGGTTLPDMRGYVPRGLDTTGSVDPLGAGRSLGDT